MKKIINGKVYDTDTAQLRGIDGGGDGFSSWNEELYQKRTGEFFLYGEGGPATKYAYSIGQNQWSGGSKIIPLSVDAAREWVEKHLDADEYEEIFGIPDEDNGERSTLCVQLPSSLVARIRANAADRQISMTAYIESVLNSVL